MRGSEGMEIAQAAHWCGCLNAYLLSGHVPSTRWTTPHGPCLVESTTNLFVCVCFLGQGASELHCTWGLEHYVESSCKCNLGDVFRWHLVVETSKSYQLSVLRLETLLVQAVCSSPCRGRFLIRLVNSFGLKLKWSCTQTQTLDSGL